MPEPEDEWEISIFVPQDTYPTRPEDPNIKDQGLSWLPGRRVEKVGAKVMEQWQETVDRLMSMTSAISDKASEWDAEEITVGFTLSAKGELLFIAEAGASASISVKLRKVLPTD